MIFFAPRRGVEVERPHPLFRLLCALGLLTLIFTAARTINPASSNASNIPAEPSTKATLVGTLKSEGYTVHVFENSLGEQSFTLYGPDGAMLAERITLDELRNAAPDMKPETITTAEEPEPTEPAAPVADAPPQS